MGYDTSSERKAGLTKILRMRLHSLSGLIMFRVILK